MAKIDILLPTYKRPLALAKVAKNLEETTKHDFTLWFGLEADDEAGQRAAEATGHRWLVNPYEPGYSNTIQALYEASDGEFITHANDDFEFRPDWDEVPIAMFDRESLMVVGMRQHENDDHGSAISMFRRKYIEEQSGVIDMPNRVFYPYPHHFVDTEFTETAKYRNVWAKCDVQGIDHRHYGFTGADRDQTYIKNDNTSEQARIIYESRRHLWGS